MAKTGTSNKGFASLSPERRREISSKGGKRAQELTHGNRFTTETSLRALEILKSKRKEVSKEVNNVN